MRRFFTSDTVRSFTFGIEDSLVSTIGLVSGIAAVGVGKEDIILTGFILVFVEAFSMSVGSLLSDNSAREFEQHKEVSFSVSISSAIVMFVSYLVAGLIIIAPYLLFSVDKAFSISIVVSIIALFLLGMAGGIASRISPVKKGFMMAILGGVAVFVGIGVGVLIK